MIIERPSHYFMAAGSAEGASPLNAFDAALLKAGVGDTNLVRLSSILPPGCQHMERIRLPYGALVPVAYGSFLSSDIGQVISAAVAVAIPKDASLPGLIMEAEGTTPLAETKERARAMALEGMGLRQRAVENVFIIGAEHQVRVHGAVFAGLVLWNRSDAAQTPYSE